MQMFEYTARDQSSGSKVSALVQAESESAASKLILGQGLVPIEIKAKRAEKRFSSIRSRVTSRDRVLFSRQLATLVNAGMPITQSLRAVNEQTDNTKLKGIVDKVISSVEGGNAFGKALEQHPKEFDNVYTSLVGAGEASGTLGESLERIATQQEKDATMKSKIKGAMYYPGIVLVVICLVIVFMLTTVLPQVEALYADLNQKLPLLTSILLFISKLITNYWYVFILILVASAWALRLYAKSPGGMSVIHRLIPSVPVFGKLFKKVYMARFSRTSQTLIKAGVPMLDMLAITGKSVNNIHIEKAIARAADKVKGGEALSSSIKVEPLFLPLVPQMIKIGEESGALDTMLEKAASFYEEEVDNQINTISSTIEPVLMVFLGAVALLMVAAILLPIYSLVGQNVGG